MYIWFVRVSTEEMNGKVTFLLACTWISPFDQVQETTHLTLTINNTHIRMYVSTEAGKRSLTILCEKWNASMMKGNRISFS